jgi:S-adenosylmethionine hydrolase
VARYARGGRAAMTFHGRDIFAPAAGDLLNGLGIGKLGPPPETYKLLDLPAPSCGPGRIDGEVLYVDGFGNLISNIPSDMVLARCGDPERAAVTCGRRRIGAIRGTYGFVEPGKPLALFNSMRLLEVAVNQGRADEVLKLGVGARVCVVPKPPAPEPNAK